MKPTKSERSEQLGYTDGLADHPFPDLAVGDENYARGWERGRKERDEEGRCTILNHNSNA